MALVPALQSEGVAAELGEESFPPEMKTLEEISNSLEIVLTVEYKNNSSVRSRKDNSHWFIRRLHNES